ncbi:VOC family protein [Pseudonocardia xishanensis]|uniref:Guanosine polyphosphate pyrophosphohydrolase n=1 Tax=Pseudonocardia xishanensis TaxID=630995 RepID=A0ABP8RLN3_9PSEU
MAKVTAGLIVIYTERLDQCRDFYGALGLDLVREQHGSGPVHYAAELEGGLVLEIYPGSAEQHTGRLRLGLTVPATARLSEGERRLTDPDGRTIVVTVGRAG